MTRILSWNVNGVRAAARKGLIEWIGRERPDILCLQEIRALPEEADPRLRRLRGYEARWHPAERRGYSGVATFSRPRPKAVTMGTGKAAYDREGRVLVHDYPGFSLFNVYFPNGKSGPERLAYKLRFYNDFLHLLGRWRRRGQGRIVLCGDVNTAHRPIDLARPKENEKTSGFLPEERAWIDRLLESGFVDAFRRFEDGPGHYTWWDQQTRARERNVGWRIDYFFVSRELEPALKAAFHRPEVAGSDHCPVGIALDL